MRNPAPSRGATVISAGRGLVGAHGALLERLFAVTLEHQIGGAPDVDFRDSRDENCTLAVYKRSTLSLRGYRAMVAIPWHQ
jgi:hypothetical protein